jgi:hypothetical protein
VAGFFSFIGALGQSQNKEDAGQSQAQEGKYIAVACVE